MTNNDILRRVRFALDLSDAEVMRTFAEAGEPASRAEISDWLKRDDDPAFQPCTDRQLACFLNGLIVVRRGRRDGPQPVPEDRLSNNMVFMKLRIALKLNADQVLDTLALADFRLSRHELSALFRKPGHKHYRPCQDQVLRRFLHGMQLAFRPEAAG